MAKAKGDLLERAAALLVDEKTTSAEIDGLLPALRAREREVAARRDAIEPPVELSQAPPGTPGIGAPGAYDRLSAGGAEYRRAVLSGAPADVAALKRESELLEAELEVLYSRRKALEQRAKQLGESERIAAAPGRLAELKRTLGDVLTRAEAAIAEARTARGAADAWWREALTLQELVGRDDAVVTPVELRRLGVLLSHRVHQVEAHVLESVSAPTRRIPALFNVFSDLLQAVRLLGAPAAGVLVRLKRAIGLRQDDDGEDPTLRAEINRQRALLLAEGKLDELGDVERLARATIAGAYSSHGPTMQRLT